MGFSQKVENKGNKLVLAGMQESVIGCLRIMQIDKYFTITKTVEEAFSEF